MTLSELAAIGSDLSAIGSDIEDLFAGLEGGVGDLVWFIRLMVWKEREKEGPWVCWQEVQLRSGEFLGRILML